MGDERPAMKVSVVIPAYNEIDTLAELLERVRATAFDKEIILVDDGSTDGTAELARSLEDRVDRLIFHERNRGKGAAVRSGFAAAAGDVILIQDADLEYDPADYEGLLEPIFKTRRNCRSHIVKSTLLFNHQSPLFSMYFLPCFWYP